MALRDPSPIPPLQPSERGVALIVHVSTLIPLWGTVLNALLFFAYREKSRGVRLLALQGVHFSLILLCVFVAKYGTDLFIRLVLPLSSSPVVAEKAERLTDFALWGFYTLFALCCLAGMWQALRGRILSYPFVGKRLGLSFESQTRTHAPQ